MTPNKKPKEYIIMDKNSGHIVHEGADRRSILPNAGDFRTQATIAIGTVILTAIMGLLGYCGDVAYKGIQSSIDELKINNQTSLQKIWTKISSDGMNGQNQFQWVLQQCCENAKTSPPLVTQ